MPVSVSDCKQYGVPFVSELWFLVMFINPTTFARHPSISARNGNPSTFAKHRSIFAKLWSMFSKGHVGEDVFLL